MAGTPPEYYVRYRRTDISNRHNDNTPLFFPLNTFTVSGNTNVAMGKITRIVFRHTHSSTKYVTWKLYGQLAFADGTTLNSDIVSHRFSGDVYTYDNTFDTSTLSVEQWESCTGIWQRIATPLPGTGTLYYRAVSEAPLDVYIYFWAAADLVDGAEPPVVSGITLNDSTGAMTQFGSPVQGKSNLTITGIYQLDPNYVYLTAKHTLRLTTSAGVNLYQAVQTENALFSVGPLNAAGTITWTYTVLDSAGNSVTQTGTFTTLAYSPPTVSALFVERYTASMDDQGDPIYIAADDGENVRFSFIATTAAVAGKNGWTLALTYGEDGTDEDGGTAITIQTGTDGESLAFAADRTILTAAISASTRWWFKITLTDTFGSSSMMAYVDEATAYFTVEKLGVAVGMRSTATPSDRRFEVAEGVEARFYGGIHGVTNFYLFGHPTGGRWINGKPLYRETLVVEITAAGTNITHAIDSNIEYILDFQGVLLTSNGSQRPINWGGYSTSYYCTLWRNQSDAEIVLRASEKGFAYVTILYTRSDDPIRTIWAYSAEDGRIILVEQVEGSVLVSENDGHVNITALAGEAVSYDALTGRITIGTSEGGA